MDSKELVGLTLDYWKYLFDNNLCTMEQLDAFAKIAERDLDVLGTAEDFALFTGKPEQQVRNVLHRTVMEKPKRRVYYKFHSFIKNIPKSWLKTK